MSTSAISRWRSGSWSTRRTPPSRPRAWSSSAIPTPAGAALAACANPRPITSDPPSSCSGAAGKSSHSLPDGIAYWFPRSRCRRPLWRPSSRSSSVPRDDLAITPFTFPFNITGQPAISLPLGQSTDGLPIGVQLVGRLFDEATLIALAAQVERAAFWGVDTQLVLGRSQPPNLSQSAKQPRDKGARPMATGWWCYNSRTKEYHRDRGSQTSRADDVRLSQV